MEENTKSFLGEVRKCQMPAASVLATYFEREGVGLFKLYLVTMETTVVQTSLSSPPSKGDTTLENILDQMEAMCTMCTCSGSKILMN